MSDSSTFDPDAPTDDLIAFALSHPPTGGWEDAYWDVVALLHKRGTRDIFDAATRLLASPCPIERELGVDLHAQLGYEQGKPFAAESVRMLARLLDTEDELHVIYSTLIAFGHLQQPECVPAVLRFAGHPDPDIRYGVTFALAGRDDPNAIAALIALTTDVSVKVRDWATFDLGSQTEWDSPELRAALCERLGDSDNITRGEALKGLALRRAEGVVEAVEAELRGPDPHSNAIEAADELADPRLVPALEALRGGEYGGEWLESVIEACRAGG